MSRLAILFVTSEMAPWVKTGGLGDVAAALGGMVVPALLDLLGQDEARRDFTAVGVRIAPGTPLPAPAGVFPRHQVE